MTRTERTYYVVFGLYNLSMWFLGPVYPLFLLSLGLDLFQINLVLGVFLICTFAFEVPTGAIADRFGRKLSFLLSCAVRMAAFGLYAFAEDLGDCLVAECLDAIGMTLASGALDAWAVDGMHAEGDRRPTDRFFMRAQIVSRVMIIASGLIGAYVAAVSFRLSWVVAAGNFALTGAIAAVWMREHRPVAARETPRASWLQTMTEGLQLVGRKPMLLLLCVVTMLLLGAAIPVNMLWPKRMEELSGAGVWFIGWIWVMINAVALVGSMLMPRLLARFSRTVVLAATMLWRAAMLGVAAAATGFYPALAGLLLQEIGMGVSEPVLQAWMNEHVDAERRATVLSVRSMFGTLGGAVGLVVLGLVARDHGIPAAWWLGALGFAATAAGFVALRWTERME
jgi:MFS family permease